MPSSPRIVYSRKYNVGCFGLERLHPFDSRKYGRAWRILRRQLGRRLRPARLPVDRPIAQSELLAIHTRDYLNSLRDSSVVAGALEVPLARRIPARLLDWCVLRPMRWAVRGTVLAAAAALQHGVAVNLSGGYHHAKPGGGEGFSIYSDIALAIHQLRAGGVDGTSDRLRDDDRVAYIDLDAHQGNGVCHYFFNDSRVFLFDMYNQSIYPRYDVEARQRLDCDIPLPPGCTDELYMRKLQTNLPGFLGSIQRSAQCALAIYNAGNDVFEGDTLGGLRVSAETIVRRDRFVVDQCRRREIPVLMLASGGYGQESHHLLARSVAALFEDTA